ncbi:MAG TPA: AAA family ATPase [Haliscomenobacter sp.]|uniref:AAA family ATPase n=1 Tax=Haliscomenobacter sp. TaxID=2717303 RepID=UPI002BA20DB2|nr:AAA family ATPase [Haliscomenobacter sp.]HOY16619.1 AAA family ATPase [Haliscomenobacter sp.]
MERLHYPILYYPISDQAVLGLLVGSEQQAIAANVDTLKLKFQNHLQREYKKTGSYPEIRINEAKLKVFTVSFRPSLRDSSGVYPLPREVVIPIPAVFGASDSGFYHCYLPVFQEGFIYYSPEHFEALTDYVAISNLNRSTPEDIYKLMRYGNPGLTSIELRVNPRNNYYWKSNWNFRNQQTTLSRLGEAYPPLKATRRLNRLAPDVAWEREAIIEQVVEKVLSSRANVLIIGNPGSGKSAVLQAAIRKMTNKAKSAKLKLNFWRILPQRLTNSAKYLGEWQATCEELIEEAASTNSILWMVSIVRMLMSGGSGPEDSLASFFRPFLTQGKVQMISEATPQELESMRRLMPGFVDAFHLIHLEEMTEFQVQNVLTKYALFAQNTLKINIEKAALDLSYRLLSRFYPYESFPGKAVKFLGKCMADARLNRSETVGIEDVNEHFIQQTGLPELLLNDDMEWDEAELLRFFHDRIIGQPRAVEQLCSLVKIFKAGINNPQRPIATLIFAGPTGVGKTACAKTLAEYFFGKGQQKTPLIRIDMSEYQHAFQIDRLIGADREPGQLVKEVREKPFAVLLLDEIEKADPAIFDALLAVLDDGMLVDGFGRVTHFKNTIIIMTSNLGASSRRSMSFSDTTSSENRYLSAIMQHFRPEFVNRIDSVVVFDELSKEGIRNLAKRELRELGRREGFTKKSIKLQFSERLIDYLVTIGFDERYGARPMQRAIEQGVIGPLALWLLENPDTTNHTLIVDYEGGIVIQS